MPLNHDDHDRCSLRTRAKQLVRNAAKALLVGITSLVKGAHINDDDDDRDGM